jgi:uncharacterized protein (TIGR02300 family)
MKAEWGTRRSCLKCQALFYDMQKSQIVCPKCGKGFTPKDFIAKPMAVLNNDIPETEEDRRRVQNYQISKSDFSDDLLGEKSAANVDDLLSGEGGSGQEELVKDGFI